MTDDMLKDLLTSVAASARQVNILTGEHASAPYYEAAAGTARDTTKTEGEMRRAVVRLMEACDERGCYIVTEQEQFYAIKAVLTLPRWGLPAKPSAFQQALHNLGIDNLRVPYSYESVRKVSPHQLPKNVELWGQYHNTADEYSMKQVVTAVKLMELLDEERQRADR